MSAAAFVRNAFSAAIILFCSAAAAHEFKVGDIHVGHPYARTTVPGQPSGGVYLSLENKGKKADKLVAASSPAAKTVEIHTMSMDGNIMRMREVSHIEVAPAAKVDMQPGSGYHIMLMGLTAPLKTGDRVPMTLTFEKAGKVDVQVNVEEVSAPKQAAPAHHQH